MRGEKPGLLYLSPVLPATGGNGLAMRAGMVLRALATRYRVSLLVFSLYQAPSERLAPELLRACHEALILRHGQQAGTDSWLRRLGLVRQERHVRVVEATPARWEAVAAAHFADKRFDVVHLFRLATLPFAASWLRPSGGPASALHLDLDDVESLTSPQLAALFRRNGQIALAAHQETAAARAAILEEEALARFDRVYVCSEGDAARLRGRGRAAIRVLPNAIQPPARVHTPSAGTPYTLLFVGTLDYYPNEDGLLWFCRRVLPLVQPAAQQCRLVIVGTGAGRSVQGLASLPGVRLVGPAPELAPWYAQAHAVVVPLRAGGGSRIKVLEAFGYGRPVIGTSVGLEGIEALPERHALVGDTPEAFAAACLRLIGDRALGERLAANGRALLNERYNFAALARTVAAQLDPPAPPG